MTHRNIHIKKYANFTKYGKFISLLETENTFTRYEGGIITSEDIGLTIENIGDTNSMEYVIDYAVGEFYNVPNEEKEYKWFEVSTGTITKETSKHDFDLTNLIPVHAIRVRVSVKVVNSGQFTNYRIYLNGIGGNR